VKGYDRALVEKRKEVKRAKHELVMRLALRSEGVTVRDVRTALSCGSSHAINRLVRLQGSGFLERRGAVHPFSWHARRRA
jgi:hypothetical protein